MTSEQLPSESTTNQTLGLSIDSPALDPVPEIPVRPQCSAARRWNELTEDPSVLLDELASLRETRRADVKTILDLRSKLRSKSQEILRLQSSPPAPLSDPPSPAQVSSDSTTQISVQSQTSSTDTRSADCKDILGRDVQLGDLMWDTETSSLFKHNFPMEYMASIRCPRPGENIPEFNGWQKMCKAMQASGAKFDLRQIGSNSWLTDYDTLIFNNPIGDYRLHLPEKS